MNFYLLNSFFFTFQYQLHQEYFQIILLINALIYGFTLIQNQDLSMMNYIFKFHL